MKWLALDIGGANIKAADGHSFAVSQPFPMWENPHHLVDAELGQAHEGSPAWYAGRHPFARLRLDDDGRELVQVWTGEMDTGKALSRRREAFPVIQTFEYRVSMWGRLDLLGREELAGEKQRVCDLVEELVARELPAGILDEWECHRDVDAIVDAVGRRVLGKYRDDSQVEVLPVRVHVLGNGDLTPAREARSRERVRM